jgi:hypothetical protein
MTELLKEAFAEAEKLPREEQDAFARWLLEELASEKRWSDLLARSQGHLAELATEALEENRTGQTRPLDPDSL